MVTEDQQLQKSVGNSIQVRKPYRIEDLLAVTSKTEHEYWGRVSLSNDYFHQKWVQYSLNDIFSFHLSTRLLLETIHGLKVLYFPGLLQHICQLTSPPYDAVHKLSVTNASYHHKSQITAQTYFVVLTCKGFGAAEMPHMMPGIISTGSQLHVLVIGTLDCSRQLFFSQCLMVSNRWVCPRAEGLELI